MSKLSDEIFRVANDPTALVNNSYLRRLAGGVKELEAAKETAERRLVVLESECYPTGAMELAVPTRENTLTAAADDIIMNPQDKGLLLPEQKQEAGAK